MAAKTKKVFFGHDTWPIRMGGQLYGPGTVEVSVDVAEKLEAAMARISGGMVDTTAVDTPPPGTVERLTDEELLEAVRQRGLSVNRDDSGYTDGEKDNSLAGAAGLTPSGKPPVVPPPPNPAMLPGAGSK